MSTPKYYLLAFQLKSGKFIQRMTTDLAMPGPKSRPVADMPQELRTYILGHCDPAATAGPNLGVYLQFPKLPLMLEELANWLIPQLAEPIAYMQQVSALQEKAFLPAGNAYEDAGIYVEPTDRLLRWLLSKHNNGLMGSECRTTRKMAVVLDEFLATPTQRGSLLSRVQGLQVAHTAFTTCRHRCQSARNACRAYLAVASEYQGWELLDAEHPEATYDVAPRQGAGILRRLAEYGLAHCSPVQQPAYLAALAQQLVAALSAPTPLPHAYPASRSRVQLVDSRLQELAR